MIHFLNECGRLWWEPFGLVVAQNTIFLGIVFAALYLLRNTSARVLYAVAMLGLAKLITPPFIAANVKSVPGYIELSGLTSLPSQPIAIPGVAEATPASLTLAGMLVALWCLVAVGVIVHAVVSTKRLHLALQDAEDATDIDSVRLMRETGVQVRVADKVPVPMTVGVFPTTIYVPPDWRAWTAPGRRAVLRHEMAHIHRHDGLVRALEILVRALYWFHPLVPLLAQRINVYREQACDERAADPDPEGRITYSKQLVEIAENLLQRQGVRGSASALLRHRNELFGRIHYLTREDSAMKFSKVRTIILTAALVVAAMSLSWYRGTAMPAAPEGHAVVELSVASDGRVTVDGKSAELKQIGDAIKKEIGDQEAVVYIKCDETVPMKTLFQVHAVLRESGVLKVSYAGMDGGQMPLVLPNENLIQRVKDVPDKYIMNLKVKAGGKYVLDGAKVKPDEIHKFVEQRLADEENLIVSLTMAEDATYGQYVQALKELRQAEAQRIFINEPAAL